MKHKSVLAVLLLPLCLAGCYVQQPATTHIDSSFRQYKYVYIIPTGAVTSNESMLMPVFGGGVVAGSSSKSVNPSDVIAGYLMQKGYTMLPNLSPEFADKTLIVSYGELDRYESLLGNVFNVMVQFSNAQGEVIGSSVADDVGSTEAMAVRNAVYRALEAIFANL